MMKDFSEGLEKVINRNSRRLKNGIGFSMFKVPDPIPPKKALPTKKRQYKGVKIGRKRSVDVKSDFVKASKTSFDKKETTCEVIALEDTFGETQSVNLAPPCSNLPALGEKRASTAEKEKEAKKKGQQKSVQQDDIDDSKSILSSQLSSQLPGYHPMNSVLSERSYNNDFNLFWQYEEANTRRGFLVEDIFDRVNHHLMPKVSNPLLAKSMMETSFQIPPCFNEVVETFNAVEQAMFRLMSEKPFITFSEMKSEAFKLSKQ